MTFALKFISGKYQGGEFPLPEQGELLIGRQSDLDVVLVEDMVSRKHAKLVITGPTALNITDLGSTNGTFVNGEKVRRADLKRGDRLLIGTSILKVVDKNDILASTTDAIERNAMLQDIASRAPSTSTMSGELDEVPLPDLLQLYATNKKSGILSISGPNRGKAYIKQGQLLYAVIGGEPPMKPMKAICRMLTWDKGAFNVEAFDDSVAFPETFAESTESVLIEALRQSDEVKRLLPELPAPEAALSLSVPMMPKLSALNPSQLETLQLVINFGNLKSVVEKTPGTDHEALTNITKLLREGYVETE